MSDELAEAYRENSDQAAEVNELWSTVSIEASQHLGEPPEAVDGRDATE